MRTNYQNSFEKDCQKLLDKYDKKSEDYKQLKHEYQLLKQKYDDTNKIIDEKDKKIARLKALLNTDGTNAGIPTSQTPLNKKKIIPNTREKTGKSKGGQVGHQKHKLEKFSDEEVNDNVYHTLDKCPCCNGNLHEIGEICKDELSYRFVPIKRRNHYTEYICESCHKKVHQNIPNRLKEENQYGSEVQAMALSLANEGNVSMNKIRHTIRGFFHGKIDMSEGYIAKLQKQASQKLENFKNDLYKKVLKLELLYWDDRVIMINTKRSCLRIYGDDKIAYYTAHETKGEKGIPENEILNTLSK